MNERLTPETDALAAGVITERDALFASVSREDLIHLCIFLAGYQAKLQDVRGKCMSIVGDDRSKAWDAVINHWPIIQGSRNQIHLIRIGELGYDPDAVARAVKGAGEPAAQLAFEKANATNARKPST